MNKGLNVRVYSDTMSEIGTDEAIEKLAAYRKDSEENKEEAQRKRDADDLSETEKKIRNFFLNYYYFNATITTAIGTALLIAGWIKLNPILSVPMAALGFLFTRQTFRTIDRLNASDGRKTTIDDVFVVLLTIALFFSMALFTGAYFSLDTFIIIHSAMSVIWLIQIIMVNYRKPEYKGASAKEKMAETEMSTGTILDHLTKERAVVLGIGIVLGILISYGTLATRFG